MTNIIETKDLNFGFSPSVRTLHHLNLQIESESIYCFLGPNGAGKTTTLRILLGLLKADHQRISIFGQHLNSNRLAILKRIGSLIEQPSLYHHLTGHQNLELYRLTFRCDQKRIPEVLSITGLSEARHQLVKTYSLGMKQRLAIALALLHDPELLILDEPTNGLDPQGIIEIRGLIKQLKEEFHKTILVSSHLLSEVEKIATHVGILHKGCLLFQGSSRSLMEMKSENTAFELELDAPEKAMPHLENSFNVRKISETTLSITGMTKEQVPVLLARLVKQDLRIYRAAFGTCSLEDLFLDIIPS
ncbi:ABC-2 type transport system ATP-binding protein [Chryseolinea serpens]|uniref:ABC-2 type transport system ATP-binding protein n=1 Tax=Chryseolinea serpens TaxID=947013 RepID=A0A1M5M090_9BACT|nr:ABC transporter ATP-binding protein [Chryseolinea serpens]SHG70349.1 ABC-2 type transport system ATP-binding protein [Chryseolinea serpens]